MVIIKPIHETEKAVTLTRSDYEALLNAAEDAADLVAVNSHRAR